MPLIPIVDPSNRPIVRLASFTNSYRSPSGFKRVLHVVPRETLHHDAQGGARIKSAPGPAQGDALDRQIEFASNFGFWFFKGIMGNRIAQRWESQLATLFCKTILTCLRWAPAIWLASHSKLWLVLWVVYDFKSRNTNYHAGDVKAYIFKPGIACKLGWAPHKNPADSVMSMDFPPKILSKLATAFPAWRKQALTFPWPENSSMSCHSATGSPAHCNCSTLAGEIGLMWNMRKVDHWQNVAMKP